MTHIIDAPQDHLEGLRERLGAKYESTVRVAEAMLHFAGDGWRVFASLRSLQWRSGYSRRAVVYALEHLTAVGFCRRADDQPYRTVVYVIAADWAEGTWQPLSEYPAHANCIPSAIDGAMTSIAPKKEKKKKLYQKRKKRAQRYRLASDWTPSAADQALLKERRYPWPLSRRVLDGYLGRQISSGATRTEDEWAGELLKWVAGERGSLVDTDLRLTSEARKTARTVETAADAIAALATQVELVRSGRSTGSHARANHALLACGGGAALERMIVAGMTTQAIVAALRDQYVSAYLAAQVNA
ncbi:hypothetical protein [Hydrocarboniphaga effusa]|jgi:hypothetical protein|uniref:hypothetical protein n=1 Tax=Hydrocarboniphaga effusa TaxID=243629 RepID=UPI003138457D